MTWITEAVMAARAMGIKATVPSDPSQLELEMHTIEQIDGSFELTQSAVLRGGSDSPDLPDYVVVGTFQDWREALDRIKSIRDALEQEVLAENAYYAQELDNLKNPDDADGW